MFAERKTLLKKSNILYGIAIVAVIGILSGVVGYTFPTQTPTQTPASAVTTPTKTDTTTAVSTSKKEGCGCCAERRTRLENLRKQARERQQLKQMAARTNAR